MRCYARAQAEVPGNLSFTDLLRDPSPSVLYRKEQSLDEVKVRPLPQRSGRLWKHDQMLLFGLRAKGIVDGKSVQCRAAGSA